MGDRTPDDTPAPPPASIPLCSWNAENLFDDDDDPDDHDADENWFGRNPEVVAEKVDNLADGPAAAGRRAGPGHPGRWSRSRTAARRPCSGTP